MVSKRIRYASELRGQFKVSYRPIEAAIRWSGLARQEPQILDLLKGRAIPDADEFRQWPALRVNTERIYDGLINKELRCGINGVTAHDEPDIDHPDLTIRHVDLKSWMKRYYPDQRPRFLFSRIERDIHPVITIDAVQALVLQRDALKILIEQREREIHALHAQNRTRLKESDALTESHTPHSTLSPRGETTYLHIVGSLLSLLVGRSPSGQPYSSFRTQESVISAMVAHHGQRLGIAERTLEEKFAAAKRSLAAD